MISNYLKLKKYKTEIIKNYLIYENNLSIDDDNELLDEFKKEKYHDNILRMYCKY